MPSTILSGLDHSDVVALWVLSSAALIGLELDRRGNQHRAWAVWAVALLAVTLPLAHFQLRPNWPHVSSWPLKASDIAANIVLYVPFGFWASRPSRGAWRVMAAAALLSVVTETSQLFSQSRYPSLTDVASDVVGAAAGGLLWQLRSRAVRPRAASGPTAWPLHSDTV